MDMRVQDSHAVTHPASIRVQRGDLHRYIAAFRRRQTLFLAVVAGVFSLAVILTFQLSPRYTATAAVMLDARPDRRVEFQAAIPGAPVDSSAIDTQIEVLRSRALAEKVVEALSLVQDPEFNPAPHTLFGPKPRRQPDAIAQAATVSAVVDRVMHGLKVRRTGLSYMIEVSFEAASPTKAAKLADAFADHYLLEQLGAKFDATHRTADWLGDRIAGLRGQVEAAEAQVQAYRAAHGLMASSEAGATITQQEISNLNTSFATARAEEAEAEAKLSTARRQMARGSNGDDVGEALSSPVITQLRQQRAQLSSQAADLAGRYGPQHPAMLKAQRQLAELDALVQAEIKRITSNLEAQAQVAHQRTASIAASLGASKGSLASSNAASVKLNELLRNAESVRTLYQSFLDRFKQTTAQQGAEQTDARVVSHAHLPTAPSFPNKPLILLAGMAIALALGGAATAAAAALEDGVFTGQDVERILEAAHLGSIPSLATILDGAEVGATPTRHVLDQPMSSFAEAFRSLRASILYARLGEPVRTVAIASALPGEGKTTTCICLGRIIAMGGASTVVVDCDLRRRMVNRLFSEEPEVGLLEVLAGAATLDQALIRDEASGAMFLPLAKAPHTPRDVFASPAMDALLAELRRRFQMTLLDMAPILAVADGRVLAPKADVVVFLTRWRRTPHRAAENALRQLESVGAHIAGVCLTQMDMREQARSGYGDTSYYFKSYRGYFSGAYGESRAA